MFILDELKAKALETYAAYTQTQDTYLATQEKYNAEIEALRNATRTAANVALDAQRAYEDRLATLKHRQKEKKG